MKQEERSNSEMKLSLCMQITCQPWMLAGLQPQFDHGIYTGLRVINSFCFVSFPGFTNKRKLFDIVTWNKSAFMPDERLQK